MKRHIWRPWAANAMVQLFPEVVSVRNNVGYFKKSPFALIMTEPWGWPFL
jgi:hypothetical protein